MIRGHFQSWLIGRGNKIYLYMVYIVYAIDYLQLKDGLMFFASIEQQSSMQILFPCKSIFVIFAKCLITLVCVQEYMANKVYKAL